MSKLTDDSIIDALQKGKTINLNGDVLIRELLNGSESLIYALYQEEIFWKPYSPNVWELSQTNWQIMDEE